MFGYAFLVLLCILSIFPENFKSELVSVVVVTRHGDITSKKFFPNDKYKDLKYWPDGLGQLTKVGSEETFRLGLWLGEHYKQFLSKKYPTIKVISAFEERCVKTAANILNGIAQATPDNQHSQPITIHTLSEDEDPFINMNAKCSQHRNLMRELLANSTLSKQLEQHADFFEYLTYQTGLLVKGPVDVKVIYDALLGEQSNNYPLPLWTLDVFPEKLEPFIYFYFITPAYTLTLARLKVGLLLNEIVNIFRNFIHNPYNEIFSSKFTIYSGHKHTLGPLLYSMNILAESNLLPFASAFIFELHKDNSSNFYVNLFYKNNTSDEPLVLPGCSFNCGFDSFENILSPILINLDEWKIACGNDDKK